MSSRAIIFILGVSLALSGCSAGMGLGTVSPDEIPELERVVSDDANNAAAWARLGVAYGAADQPYEARKALERAVALPGTPAAAWAHLGTWREEAGDIEGAAVAYRSYLAEGGEEAAESVKARLTVVRQQLLERRARDALARESALIGALDPTTVAVMPLTVDAPERYQPLGVGLAELLTTDLSLTDRLNVLERAQLSALVDEMELALGGYTDTESASRVGRLLQAGRLVQGQIAIDDAGDATQVTALVMDAEAAEPAGEASESGVLDQLMELEVQLALQIYRQLGIELTDAEVARLEDKPTRNLQAFLAYSEGLQLLDAGRYNAAAARFENAASLDPGFNAAREAAGQSRRAGATQTSQVSQEATTELASAIGPGGSEPVAPETRGSPIDQLVNATVPAGATATETGATAASTATRSTTVETTETTAGTGVGKVVRIPIVLTRPRPFILLWRVP
ncbi:MAG: CsgG/HfaB family protein [Longimicrobiales bacterium]